MEMKFYRCPCCGQIVAKVTDTGVPLTCCGDVTMEEIVPGSVDAAKEKHVPTYKVEDGKVIVDVGSVAHPMTEEHHIAWVALRTTKGNQRKALTPGSNPHVCFHICGCEEVVEVLAYCNLHGLWKA